MQAVYSARALVSQASAMSRARYRPLFSLVFTICFRVRISGSVYITWTVTFVGHVQVAHLFLGLDVHFDDVFIGHAAIVDGIPAAHQGLPFIGGEALRFLLAQTITALSYFLRV